MRDLYHLTGIPIPESRRTGFLGSSTYADHKFRFRDFRGVVGSSDLRGTIEEDPGQERPMVTADPRLDQGRPPRHDRGGSRPGAADGHRRPSPRPRSISLISVASASD